MTPWCTACRCITCTGWYWVCSVRCASEIASCTPGNRRRKRMRRPVARLYFGVPTVWSRVVDDRSAARALASARLLVSGSAALPVPVFDKLAEVTGHRPVERYGASESLITVSTRADGERRPGWVGLPLTGIETRLVDEDRSAVPRDGETIGRASGSRPDDVRRLLQPPGCHRRGVRRRQLVSHRRRRRDRRRRHAPDRGSRVGRHDQDRRIPGRRRRDRDRAARSSREWRRWLSSASRTTTWDSASSRSSSERPNRKH